MASIRVLKETGTLFFDFRVRGTRCREYTSLRDTPTNRKKLQKVLERIELDIQTDVFDYARYFPNSKMLGVLVNKGPVAGTVMPAAPSTANGIAIAASVAATPDFRTYTDTWYAQHEIEWKRSYRLTVRGMLDQHLIPHFGTVPVGQIARDDLLLFRASLGKLEGRGKRASLSPKRINQIMGTLQRVMEEGAERYGFVCPYRKIKPLKLIKSDVQPFTLEEVRTLIDTIRDDYRQYLTVRCFTGLRTGEVDGLRWEYVDFDKRQILVRQTIVRGQVDSTKTYESVRDVAMSQIVFNALKVQHEATAKQRGYVFCNREGEPLDHNNFAKRVWYPLLRYLDLKPRRPYQMRHTAATLWLAAGESPEWIARQLGHTTTEMLFRVYSRFVPNLTRRDGSAFERMLLQSGTFEVQPSANEETNRGADTPTMTAGTNG